MKRGVGWRQRGVGAAFVLCLFLVTATRAAEVVVIVNTGVPVASLAKDDVKAIFTGNKTQWSNGKRIVPAILLDSGGVHESFVTTYVEKTPSQFDTYWKKQIFTGKGSELPSFKNEKDVVDFVARTDGAISYVSSGGASGSVKTVSIK